MLLKISLGVVILAGLATLYFSHFQVAEKINTLNTNLADTTKQRDDANAAEAKAKKEASESKKGMELAQKTVGELTNTLVVVQAKATEQEKRADKASADLLKTTEERNEAQRDLASWKALGLPIDQVRGQRDEIKHLTEERDTYLSENKIFTRQVATLKSDLERYTEGYDREVALPAGTKGKVIAVDPKYDFVVLDIGGNQGVLKDAKMLVNRGGKLVAKVKITSVQPDRSIANIMPEWKQDEIMEGDQVLY
ncbi:MAG: hypothetical protein JWM99_1616 [Verrucomicrobiales bacterium]|jgi:hypothetical protein|nr:hypothetical protein [Verrucomicrobiales bacterium]